MAERTLTVKIVGDEKDLLRAFRSSSQATQRFSVGAASVLKAAFIFEGVRAGVNAITGALRAGAAEFSEMQRTVAQTQAVLRSTGGIANVTAGDVAKLATAVSRYTGIDDEAVRAGENLLLTFKNVRNELGEGNRVFDRATKAAVDLSVAGFGGLDATSKQLGKALNDPIRGMTALGRAGVTFTESQRETIKALVESGRLLEAQKVILREVESQVGGSARAFGETLPGQLAKVREAFRNAFGNLVGAVAEPLAGALGAFADFIPKIESVLGRLGNVVGPALDNLVDAFLERLPEIQRVLGSIMDPLRETVVPVLLDFASVARDVFAGVVAVFDDNRQALSNIASNLGQVLESVWTIARPTIVFLFETALPAALRIVIPIIEKTTDVVRVMAEVWVRVVSVIVGAIDRFLGGLSVLTDALSHIPLIGDRFAGVSDAINSARETLRGFASELDAVNGSEVEVKITILTQTGRGPGRLGALGAGGPAVERDDTKTIVDRVTRATTASLNATTVGATEIATSADKATTATDTATTALERQNAAQERLRRVQQARRARQFEALGLTAEGQGRIPGVAALRQRLGNLREQVKGTPLDTATTGTQLDQIARVLSGKFGAVGRQVREAILAMFNQISGALRQGEETEGPLTKFAKRGVEGLAAGLGLTAAQTKELRSRFSQMGAGGRVPGEGVGAFGMVLGATTPRGAAVGLGFGGGLGEALIIHNHVHLDGKEISVSTTRHQQKQRTRGSASRRGVRPGV